MAHAREEHPHEACGMIAGAEGGERPERFIRMLNAAKPTGDESADEYERATRSVLLGDAHAEYQGELRSSTTYYTFDTKQRLRVQREMDAGNEWPVVIYHSHTRSPAYPSQVDIDDSIPELIDNWMAFMVTRSFLPSARAISGVVTIAAAAPSETPQQS